MQMLKDPQGAAFYVIQPEPRDPAPDVLRRKWARCLGSS